MEEARRLLQEVQPAAEHRVPVGRVRLDSDEISRAVRGDIPGRVDADAR